MNPTLQINLLKNLFQETAPNQESGSAKKGKTSLFDELFKKNMNQAPLGDWGLFLFSGPQTDWKADRFIEQGQGSNISHASLLQALQKPELMTGKIVSYLKSQGWQPEAIERLLAEARDAQGNIQVDKLLQKLSAGKVNADQAAEQGSLLIASKDAPRVQELLFKLGLGAGEVKSLVEKATVEKGELDLNKLTQALNDFSQNKWSAEDLNALFKLNQIFPRQSLAENLQLQDQIGRALAELGEKAGPDAQKGLKEILAQTLIQKGLPAEEVKTFLENMSFTRTKNQAAAGTAGWPGKENVDQQKPLSEWVKGVVMKSANQPQAEEAAATFKQGVSGKNKAQQTLHNTAAGEQENALPAVQKGKLSAEDSFLNLKNELILKSKGEQAEEIGKGLKKQSNPNDALGEWNLRQAGAMRRSEGGGIEAGRSNTGRDVYNLPEPLPKVLERLLWMHQAGEQKSRLTISPPELGKLELEIAMKSGHLQANLGAENPAVKELIEANLGQLKQQLANQGVIVDRIEVTVVLNQQSFNHERLPEGEQSSHRSGRRREQGKEPEKVEEVADRAIAGGFYQIDLHV